MEFDLDEALRAALGVFWAQGYEGASLEDLLAAMRIGRSSFYNAFGDKHRLFLAVLDLYRTTVLTRLRALVRTSSSTGEVLRKAFAAEGGPGQMPPAWGCLMVNTATERGPVDPEARLAYARYEQELCDLLTETLTRDGRPADEAWTLLTWLQGLKVQARSGWPLERLRQVQQDLAARY